MLEEEPERLPVHRSTVLRCHRVGETRHATENDRCGEGESVESDGEAVIIFLIDTWLVHRNKSSRRNPSAHS